MPIRGPDRTLIDNFTASGLTRQRSAGRRGPGRCADGSCVSMVGGFAPDPRLAGLFFVLGLRLVAIVNLILHRVHKRGELVENESVARHRQRRFRHGEAASAFPAR